jgi:hypothetical protein
LIDAPLGAHADIGIEIEAEGGVGEHDRTLISAFGDEARVAGSDAALMLNKGLAHSRLSCDCRNDFVDIKLPNAT